MDKKTMLAIALSIGVIMAYQMLFQKQPMEQVNNNTVANASSNTSSRTLSSGMGKVRATPPPIPAKQRVQSREVRVETPLYSAIFSTRGASLKSFKLKKYSSTLNNATDTIELVNLKGDDYLPLAIAFTDSSINVPHDIEYGVKEEKIVVKAGEKNRQVVFIANHGKVKIEKIFSFNDGGYDIGMKVKLTNISDVSLSENAMLFWYNFGSQNIAEGNGEHVGPIYYNGKSVEREDIKNIAAEKVAGPNIAWAGYESKYFIAAFTPQNPSLTSVSIYKDLANTVSLGVSGDRMLIPPYQTGTTSYSLFLGPKGYDILAKEGVKLEYAVDFGFFKWLAVPILLFMNFLYKYVGNYGIAIIIITIIIKIIFWPLGTISYKSMKKMQDLQPKLKDLQEKYKSDRQKLGQETMALYKMHKVNPASGCVPMLVQIPVFFGLYNALVYAIELRHSPFFWWIQDLSAKDPYYITPLLMGATMFIQQRMTPAPADPTQAKIMMWLPVVFTFMFLNLSSGLVVYWLLNNVLSIGQQLYINKKLS